MQGFKTIIVGFLMAVSAPALYYLGGVDWTAVLPSNLVWAAPILTGAVMVGMRFVTKTPVPPIVPPKAE